MLAAATAGTAKAGNAAADATSDRRESADIGSLLVVSECTASQGGFPLRVLL